MRAFFILFNHVQNIDVEGEKPALLILANKSDLTEERIVSERMGSEVAQTYGALFAEVSARNGYGVQEVRIALF